MLKQRWYLSKALALNITIHQRWYFGTAGALQYFVYTSQSQHQQGMVQLHGLMLRSDDTLHQYLMTGNQGLVLMLALVPALCFHMHVLFQYFI
jgi:hypothetical protein